MCSGREFQGKGLGDRVIERESCVLCVDLLDHGTGPVENSTGDLPVIEKEMVRLSSLHLSLGDHRSHTCAASHGSGAKHHIAPSM